MLKKAEQYKEDDKKRREFIELKNEAEKNIHTMQSQIDEHRSKLSQSDV